MSVFLFFTRCHLWSLTLLQYFPPTTSDSTNHFCLLCPPKKNCCIYVILLHLHSPPNTCVQLRATSSCRLQITKAPGCSFNSLMHLYHSQLQMCTNCDLHLGTTEMKTYTATIKNQVSCSHSALVFSSSSQGL